VELELHQLELRYEGIRKRAPVAERALVCRISCEWTHLISSKWDHPISG
jgi:hypothetical protein